MTNSKKRALLDLLEEFRITGDETLILDLFEAQESLKEPSAEIQPTFFDTEFPELNTEDTMVFSEIYAPTDTGHLSLTSGTFDEHNQAQSHDPHFLNHSDYIQTGVLGTGGMGTVLQVKDPQLKRKVAMKVLHTQDTIHHESTFLAEAQISALLQHPSIIPIYEFGTINGTPYFTMQEIRGTSLKHLFQKRSTLELREIVSILQTVTEAIAYAHSQGVVHRDLKPSNILVGQFGEVYVVDWGIAVILPHSAHRHLSMHPSLYLDPASPSIVGTVGYMSPEQAAGQNVVVSEVTDIFAIGSILYEALTEELLCPKDAPNPLQWKQKLFDDVESQAQFRARLKRTLTTNTGLEELCLRALEPDQNHRLQEAVLLAKSLQRWLNGAMKQQQALEYLAKAHGLHSEQKKLRRQIELLVESYPETDPAKCYLHYQDIVAQRLRIKECIRLQEQELHKGILHSPEIVPLHTSVIELDFQRYKRGLQHGKYDIVDDIHLKLNTHLSVLPKKERGKWEARLERCRTSYLTHRFNTPFVGHEGFGDSINEMLRTSRIMTLFGSPGIGKSRIAIEACRTHFIRKGTPFHVISCTEIQEIEQIYGKIATALQIDINPVSLDNLVPVLTRMEQTCFVLDGIESIHKELYEVIEQILTFPTQCLFLLTTRSSRDIEFGSIVEIPLLSTIDSMDLFYRQAKRSRSSFVITKENFTILLAIVRHLQHTPLSLEMVANKLSAYTLFELHEMLTTSKGHTIGSAALTPIEKTLEWSWQLLSERSQEMLTLCSYFAHNVTLSAIQAILSAFEHIEPYDTPEILQDLLESGLLLKTKSDGQTRFSIPYVLRNFTLGHQTTFEEKYGIDWPSLSKYFVEHCKNLEDTGQIKFDRATLYNISRMGTEQHHIDSAILCGQIWVQYGPWKEACQSFVRLSGLFEHSDYIDSIALWHSRLLRLSGDTNQALQIVQQINNPDYDAEKSLELALLYQLKADHSTSTTWAEKTIALTNGNTKTKSCLHAHLIIGTNQNKQTNYQAGQKSLLAIEPYVKELGELSLTIRLYSELCGSYLECAKHNDAQNAIEQGLWYTKQGHYPKEQSELYFQLAKIKILQGFYREGLPIAEQALQISRSVGDVYNEGRILLTIGVCHNKMQKYQIARQVFEDALDCYRIVGNPRGEVLVTINLVQIYPKLGLHSDMNRLFESAQHLGSQLNDKRVLGLIHSNRANYYASIGKFDEALESYDLSNVYHAEINHEKGQTIALTNQAFILWQMGDIETATEVFHQAMKQSERLNLQNNTVVLYGNFATLLMENNRLDEALDLIQQCLDLANEIQYRIGITFFSSILAMILSQQGHHEQALSSFERYAYETLQDTEQSVLYECRKVECIYEAGRIADAIETFEAINLDSVDLSQPTMWRVREEMIRTQQKIGLA